MSFSQVVPVTKGSEDVITQHTSTKRSVFIPFCGSRGQGLIVNLALVRSSRFGLIAAAVLAGGLAWSAIRFYLMIDGEDQVSEAAFSKLALSIGGTIRLRVEQDLVYQDMIANMWTSRPDLSRAEFRELVLSETYAPGLKAMTGMSLIPRVLGAAGRAALESSPDSESLRSDCCANAASTGASCADVAATGLFCNAAGEQRYQVTQFGPNGLEPAVGNTTEYIDRVGGEEYMVVDMIEPFSTNSKVWGFNLLSNEARNQAWLSAKRTGQKTFTRRLRLVQSDVAEYGVLVWLPVFKKPSGVWTTALSGNTSGLTPVGSVNGVYRAQRLLSTAMESTYSDEQLKDVTVFLFDIVSESRSESQFLAAYNSMEEDTFSAFGQTTYDDVIANSHGHWMAKKIPITIRSADAKWTVVVTASDSYLSRRRTANPTYVLVISITMLIFGFAERWLGHPTLLFQRG